MGSYMGKTTTINMKLLPMDHKHHRFFRTPHYICFPYHSNKMVSVWFITGASNGLGLSLALYVLKSGHNVIAAMRNPTRSAEAAKSIEAAGGKIFQLDVTRPQDEIFKAIETAEAIYGRIDILVNNAGYSALGPAETFRYVVALIQRIYTTSYNWNSAN